MKVESAEASTIIEKLPKIIFTKKDQTKKIETPKKKDTKKTKKQFYDVIEEYSDTKKFIEPTELANQSFG